MGGEFFLRIREKNNITAESWRAMLRDLVVQMQDKFDSNHVFNAEDSNEIFAFEYTDPVYKHKYFGLKWEWSEDAIANTHFGGRHRDNWHGVAKVCKFVCDHFPGQLALVVCDGMPGYADCCGDNSFFYDGLLEGSIQPFDGFGVPCKKIDYRKWPWTKKDR